MKTQILQAALLAAFSLTHAAAQGAGTLRDAATPRGFAIGAAVGGAFWGGDARYRPLLKREFNILVAENAMKWDQIQTRRGEFAWAKADELVAFARESGAAVRGHVFVWHQQSRWIEEGGFGREEMLSLMKAHIAAVAGRYKGKVREWDVVNEAVDDGAGTLRASFWRTRIGDDYIDSAFAFAHAADPAAKLYYNDYSAEDMGAKSTKVYNLVKGLKDRQIPIHGVGLQCHFQADAWPRPADIDRNLKRLAGLGLEVSLTEVDFRVRLPADSAALDRQKASYAALLGVCLANANCKSFLTWGFTDAHSWVPGFFTGFGAALPFDAQYQPKPAFFGLLETLKTIVSLRPEASHRRAVPRNIAGVFADPRLPTLYRDAAGRLLQLR